MRRVAFLTSGGDCQALNATMRGVAKTLYNADPDTEIIGILEGYKGLMYEKYVKMKPSDFSGILTEGGTILGSSRQPFKNMRKPDENGMDKVLAMVNTYHKLKLDCLVILGGNGTQKSANMLREEGLNVVGLPKTIDNDIWGSDMTFGFQSAVDIATTAIDCIHTTAYSHGRVFIVEVMGHKVGWLTLHAGIAGGADVILIPEIPYDIDAVTEAIQKRTEAGERFSILAVAEGALSVEESEMSKKEFKKARRKLPDPAISYRIARELGEETGHEIRVVVPGHFQRGGGPCSYDRAFATRLGSAAARLIADRNYGNMVALRNDEIVPVPLSDVAGRLKTVPADDSMIRSARNIGISFGD